MVIKFYYKLRINNRSYIIWRMCCRKWMINVIPQRQTRHSFSIIIWNELQYCWLAGASFHRSCTINTVGDYSFAHFTTLIYDVTLLTHYWISPWHVADEKTPTFRDLKLLLSSRAFRIISRRFVLNATISVVCLFRFFHE